MTLTTVFLYSLLAGVPFGFILPRFVSSTDGFAGCSKYVAMPPAIGILTWVHAPLGISLGGFAVGYVAAGIVSSRLRQWHKRLLLSC